MGEKFIPHEREDKTLIRVVVGYDSMGKPTTETRFLDAKEIQQLKEKNISFEIVTKDEEALDGGKIDEIV